jgi:hypothetical protein
VTFLTQGARKACPGRTVIDKDLHFIAEIELLKGELGADKGIGAYLAAEIERYTLHRPLLPYDYRPARGFHVGEQLAQKARRVGFVFVEGHHAMSKRSQKLQRALHGRGGMPRILVGVRCLRVA